MTKTVSISFMLSGILFSVCLILSNLLATKVITIGGFSATAGLIIFPVSYILNDTITEVWGYRKARLVIWTAFFMNFLAIVLMQLSVIIPPASYWDGQNAYAAAFSQAPRVAFASLVAFLFGSFINSYVLSRMKIRTSGKGFGIRAIVSTIFGETADSCLFFTIAFAGMVAWNDILIMMIVETVLKSAYEVLVLPITAIVVRYIKRKEQTDVYDKAISYNILKITDVH
ncbi:MAG: queuosine precursor transporter [Bacteroidales bacterium]|jgi:uncharacterized integral membrane protein (TIGR00697 family)|nr:queuosine precursor transporter [Bacteroidales bacterium]